AAVTVGRGARRRRRAAPSATSTTRVDRVIRTAARLAPPPRQEWINAMLAERGSIEDTRARRDLALGCIRVALSPSGGDASTADEVVLGTGGIAALALAVYGLVHYPGLREPGSEWLVYLGAFALMVAGCVMVGLVVARLGQPSRHALLVALPTVV